MANESLALASAVANHALLLGLFVCGDRYNLSQMGPVKSHRKSQADSMSSVPVRSGLSRSSSFQSGRAATIYTGKSTVLPGHSASFVPLLSWLAFLYYDHFPPTTIELLYAERWHVLLQTRSLGDAVAETLGWLLNRSNLVKYNDRISSWRRDYLQSRSFPVLCTIGTKKKEHAQMLQVPTTHIRHLLSGHQGRMLPYRRHPHQYIQTLQTRI